VIRRTRRGWLHDLARGAAALGAVAAAPAACSRVGRYRVRHVELASPPRDDRFAREITGASVVAYCDPRLGEAASSLLARLAAHVNKENPLREGLEFADGWTTFTLVGEGADLVLAEPDYDAVDPEATLRPDVTVSLDVLDRQLALTRQCGVDPRSIDFDQHVIGGPGVLDVDDIMLLRVESPGGRMTGWRIAPATGELGEGDLESWPVHVLWKRRPALLDALLLPAGIMAFYAKDQLQVVVGPDNEPIWTPPE
jgi:hypothetical protein